MLLRDLPVRSVRLLGDDCEPVATSAGRADYFRDYDLRRASDPRRRQQIRDAMARYRQRKRAAR